MSRTKVNKRLGIFLISYEEGIVETYIVNLLKSFSKCFDTLIVIGTAEQGTLYKEELTDMGIVICKRNEIAALMDAVDGKSCQLITYFDSQCIGPIYPVESVLEDIEVVENKFYEMVPEHYLSIKNDAFVWESFMEFLKKSQTKGSAVRVFKQILLSLGFQQMAVKYLKPFPPLVARDSFAVVSYQESSGEYARRLLDYIEEQTTYDSKLIWDSLLRTYNIQDLKTALHLEYIFSWRNENETGKVLIAGKRIAIIAHLYYEDLVEECLAYLNQMPQDIDLYLTVSDEATRDKIGQCIAEPRKENCYILWKENRGRDVSALLVTCHHILMNYEYLCFIHDKKSVSYLKKESEAQSFRYNMWENTVKSAAYVEHVIECFANHPRLGFLTPPEPFYASLLGNMGQSWGRCFEVTSNLAKQLRLDCKLDKNKLPITISNSFWCKTDAMKPLFLYKFVYEDFPKEPMAADGTLSHAIEHIWAYVAQHEKYYAAVMMNVDYASLRGNGVQHLFIKALQEMRMEGFIICPEDIEHYRNHTARLLAFCRSYEEVYIYGAGTYGQQCADILERYEQPFRGFVVSEGHRNNREIKGQWIYEISELNRNNEKVGMILALNHSNKTEVLHTIASYGFTKWFEMV